MTILPKNWIYLHTFKNCCLRVQLGASRCWLRSSIWEHWESWHIFSYGETIKNKVCLEITKVQRQPRARASVNGKLHLRLKATPSRVDVEKRESYCTVDGNVNWYSHYGEQYGDFLKKLGIKLPFDPAIPPLGISSVQLLPLGIYPKKTTIQKDTCTRMFTAALFTITRTQKQSRCPSTDKLIKKMWCIYTMEHYSAITRN